MLKHCQKGSTGSNGELKILLQNSLYFLMVWVLDLILPYQNSLHKLLHSPNKPKLPRKSQSDAVWGGGDMILVTNHRTHPCLCSAAILKSSAYRISSYRQNCALGVRFPAATDIQQQQHLSKGSSRSVSQLHFPFFSDSNTIPFSMHNLTSLTRQATHVIFKGNDWDPISTLAAKDNKVARGGQQPMPAQWGQSASQGLFRTYAKKLKWW